jgi:hypothetical protein
MRTHQLIAAAAGGLSAAAIVGAVAYATIPGNGAVYTACMLKNVGTIRLIDASLPSSNVMSHCTSLETQVAWNQKGQPGAPGLAGRDGVDGAAGADGAKGDRGDPGLRFRGTWNQFADYASGDVVQRGGSSWVATESACCGAEPGVSDSWSLLAAGGATGWEVRSTAGVLLGPRQGRGELVECPAGKRAIGGAYNASFNVNVNVSAPSPSGDGWQFEVVNLSSESQASVSLSVICENA